MMGFGNPMTVIGLQAPHCNKDKFSKFFKIFINSALISFAVIKYTFAVSILKIYYLYKSKTVTYT